MRKKVLKIYAWILGITVPYLIWFLITGIGIPCFYRETIGFLCPGCGVSRMFINMFKLDFSAAFMCNPVMFVLFFIWNGIGILCIVDKFEFLRKTKFIFISFILTMVVLVLYGILRNMLWYK